MLRLLRKCNSFAQHRKSDRLGTFLRGQFGDVKYKKSVLFCLELIYLQLRKCNSSARHQNLRSGTFPSRARSKAFCHSSFFFFLQS